MVETIGATQYVRGNIYEVGLRRLFEHFLATIHSKFTPVKCLFCILNLHLSFESQKSLAAEGRLRKGSTRFLFDPTAQWPWEPPCLVANTLRH